MSSRWPCNEKRQSTEHQDDNNGLCVASLEFPILLPKDNTLNAQRDFSSSQQIPTEKEVQHKNIQSLDQSAVVDNSHTTAKPDEDYSNQETTIDSQGPEVYVRQEGKSDILDRRWFGWTWRRWLFILGPATAIVVVAIVLVAVFVTRSRTESANTVSIPGTPPNDPLPSDPSATFNGTFNGTSVTSAYPDSSNGSLWIFYQDYAGNLVYTPLGPDGSWGSLVRLQTPKGVLKGTVLTALNWESDLRINLIYQDSSGNLRNFLYNSRKQLFSDGRVDEFQIPVSTASHMVKPFSYYDDGTGYRYIYYTGPDGLIYEYTA